MALDGRIVEYLENGKFTCAFVFEDNGNRIRVLNQNSRELNLPQNRVVHCTSKKASPPPSRDEIITLLQKTAEMLKDGALRRQFIPVRFDIGAVHMERHRFRYWSSPVFQRNSNETSVTSRSCRA